MAVLEKPDSIFLWAPKTSTLQAGILDRLVSPPATPRSAQAHEENVDATAGKLLTHKFGCCGCSHNHWQIRGNEGHTWLHILLDMLFVLDKVYGLVRKTRKTQSQLNEPLRTADSSFFLPVPISTTLKTNNMPSPSKMREKEEVKPNALALPFKKKWGMRHEGRINWIQALYNWEIQIIICSCEFKVSGNPMNEPFMNYGPHHVAGIHDFLQIFTTELLAVKGKHGPIKQMGYLWWQGEMGRGDEINVPLSCGSCDTDNHNGGWSENLLQYFIVLGLVNGVTQLLQKPSTRQ